MLAVEDLAVRYGPIAALRGVSITVDEGEFVGIVGPNGAGKSTLLFSITGAVKADTGSVSFCAKRSPASRRRTSCGAAWHWCRKAASSSASSRWRRT